MLFSKKQITIALAASIINTYASQSESTPLRQRNYQKQDLYTTEHTLALIDNNISNAYDAYNKKDFILAKVLAKGTREYALQKDLWDTNPEDEANLHLSLLMVIAGIKTHTIHQDLSDLKNVCNKQILSDCPILTPVHIAEFLHKESLSLSKKQPKLANILLQEAYYYDAMHQNPTSSLTDTSINTPDISVDTNDTTYYDKYKNENIDTIINNLKQTKINNKQKALIKLTEEHALNGSMKAQCILMSAHKNGQYGLAISLDKALQFAHLYTHELAKNPPTIPLEHFIIKALLNNNDIQLPYATRIMKHYYTYLQATRENNTELQSLTIKKMKGCCDQQSPLRAIFATLISSESTNSDCITQLMALETQKNAPSIIKSFLLSDGAYALPMLKQLLTTNPKKSNDVHYLLGLLYFYNDNFKKAYTHLTQTTASERDLLTQYRIFYSDTINNNQDTCSATVARISELERILQPKKKNARSRKAFNELCTFLTHHAPQYLTTLLHNKDVQNALLLTQLCAQHKELCNMSAHLMNLIYTYFKKNLSQDCDTEQITSSSAFKSITKYALTEKNSNCLDCISPIITDIVLKQLRSHVPLKNNTYPNIISHQDGIVFIEHSLKNNFNNPLETDLLQSLCGIFFYEKGAHEHNEHKKIAYFDQAINYGNKSAVIHKASILLPSHTISHKSADDIVAQLNTIADTSGDEQIAALYMLTDIYSSINKKPYCSQITPDDTKAFMYAQAAYDLGHYAYANLLGSFWSNGIYTSDNECFLEPNWTKSCECLTHFLETYVPNNYSAIHPNSLNKIFIRARHNRAMLYEALENYTGAYEDFKIVTESPWSKQRIKTQSLLSLGIIKLLHPQTPDREQALKHLNAIEHLNGPCINKKLLTELMLYLADITNNNKNNPQDIGLCSFFGRFLYTKDNNSPELSAIKNQMALCIKHAASHGDLLAQIKTFSLNDEEIHPHEILLHLTHALEFLKKTDDSATIQKIETLLYELHRQTLQDKYNYFVYLTRNASAEDVKNYLASYYISYALFSIKKTIDLDESYATQCKNDGLLDHYVTTFTQDPAGASCDVMNGALLYSYMTATSTSITDLQKSAVIMSKINDLPLCTNNIFVKHLLSVPYYKMGKYYVDHDQLNLAAAYLTKSADLHNTYSIIYLSKEWCKNNPLCKELTYTKISEWLTSQIISPTVNQEDRTTLLELAAQCRQKNSTKQIDENRETQETPKTTHESLQHLIMNLSSPESESMQFTQGIALINQNNSSGLEILMKLALNRHPHAALCLADIIYTKGKIDAAKKYLLLALQYGLIKSSRKNAVFKDAQLLDLLASLIINAKNDRSFLSLIKQQLLIYKVNLTHFAQYVQDIREYNLAENKIWKRNK